MITFVLPTHTGRPRSTDPSSLQEIEGFLSMRYTRFILCLTLTVAPVLSPPARAAAPIEILRGHIDQALGILKDPELSSPTARRRQYEALKGVLDRSFDFEVFSSRTLGPHTREVAPEDRDRFKALFPEFLAVFYLRQLQERYGNETIRLEGQREVRDDLVVVEAMVDLDPVRLPVEIRMVRRGGSWRVYNVVVLGIDALANYRNQVDAALMDKPLSEINRRLDERIRSENDRF